jgi:hypothetical protein
MRLILLVGMAPMLVWAQHPNRPAAHAPAPFALGGPPPRTESAARPPRAPQPIGGLPFGAQRTGFPRAFDRQRSHSSRRRDRRGAVGYFVGAPFYYSYGDYGNSIFDSPYGPMEDSNASSDTDVTANLLGEQLQRLSAQVEELKSEQRQAGPATAAAPAPPHDAPPPVAPITVVLRDGSRLQVASYAVMNRVFWDFSRQPARRIAVADIDIAASIKATASAGGEFPELATNR